MIDRKRIEMDIHFLTHDFIPYLIEHQGYDDDMVNSFLDYAKGSLQSGNSIIGHTVTSDLEYFPELKRSFYHGN